MDGRFLYIPHSVTFSKAQNRLFVADRQNGRIVSYNPLSESGEPEVFAKGLTAGGKWGSVYAISFNGTGGWPLYAIGGPTKEDREYRGHVVSQSGERSISWRPSVVSSRSWQWKYSGTSLLWTPWGHSKVSCIEKCPHFRGKFILRKHIWDIAKCP